MNIDQWLNVLHKSWINHDIESVLSLFSDDVKYWENPSKLLESKQEIAKEWNAIKQQTNIEIESAIFCSSSNNHSIKWHLRYMADGTLHESGGVYLVSLNKVGLCDYFYYVGEAYS